MTFEAIGAIEAGDGAPQPLEANAPLLLEGAENAWLLQAGTAEIFSIDLLDGEQDGPRRHVFSAEPGCLLIGFDLRRRGKETVLLAVGFAGTQVLRVPLASLKEQAGNPALARAISEGIDAWVIGLTTSLIGQEHFHTDVQLTPQTEIALADGQTAGPIDGVLWITLDGGVMSFLDGVQATASPDLAFPIADEAWFRAAGECRVRTQTTGQALGQPATWSGLAAFHRTVLDRWGQNRRAEVAAGSQRIQAGVIFDHAVQADAMSALAAALDQRGQNLRPLAAATPLPEACRLVGAALGVQVRTPPESAGPLQQRNLIEGIAKASRLRIRRVLLAGDWWQDKPGPLLGFTAGDQRPVALLPGLRMRTTMFDPSTGESISAGPGAPALEPFAYEFYRSLPYRALKGWDLLMFGMRGGRADLMRILLMGAASGVIALFIPIVTGLIFGQIIPAGEPHRLFLIAMALAASVLASTLFQIVQSIAVLRIEARVDASLQPALWDRLLSLPVPFFRAYTAGDLASRALGIDTISQLVTGVVTSSVLSSIFSGFSFLLLFYYNARLALVAAALGIVTMAAIATTGYVQLGYQRRQATLQGTISGTVLQFLTGMAKLRVAGAEARAFAVWAKSFAQQRQLAVRAQTAGNLFSVFISFWPVLASMTLFSAIASSEGTAFPTAVYIAFAAAFGQFLGGMLSLGTAATTILQIVPLYERVKPIMGTLPEVDEAKADPGLLNGEIEINGVSFRYQRDGPLALDSVSLRANPGEFVALVGPSGSGKSSVFRLLLGFERPESGSIYYDGRDLADLDTEAVRRQIGTVIQSGSLQTGSIFENIVGAAPLTQEDAWEAARMAGVDEDIRQMPMGMQTVITEGATNFSGGQRQRLLIARALVSKPRILLFDEATSALDNRTQAIVTESLKSLQATRIVIAHRLSTIQDADRVYVIVAGRVVQSGKYDELMAAEGPFAQLAQRQIV